MQFSVRYGVQSKVRPTLSSPLFHLCRGRRESSRPRFIAVRYRSLNRFAVPPAGPTACLPCRSAHFITAPGRNPNQHIRTPSQCRHRRRPALLRWCYAAAFLAPAPPALTAPLTRLSFRFCLKPVICVRDHGAGRALELQSTAAASRRHGSPSGRALHITGLPLSQPAVRGSFERLPSRKFAF